MRRLTGPKKGRGKRDRKRVPTHLRDRPRAPYFQWLEKDYDAGEDDWNDWFEVENKWRTHIAPTNND